MIIELLNKKLDEKAKRIRWFGIDRKKKQKGIWKNDKFLYPTKKPNPTSNSKIERYKIFCSEIGFTPGTEKFGDCVVEAMKKGVNKTTILDGRIPHSVVLELFTEHGIGTQIYS